MPIKCCLSGRVVGRGPNGEKYCSKCKQVLPPSSFQVSPSLLTKDKLSGWCRECRRKMSGHYNTNEKYQKRTRGYAWQRKYGVTVEEYKEMYTAQSGKCAICGISKEFSGHNAANRLHIDHCHLTGRVRALLCSQCNAGLGCFGDDAERMKLAIDYISKHQQSITTEIDLLRANRKVAKFEHDSQICKAYLSKTNTYCKTNTVNVSRRDKGTQCMRKAGENGYCWQHQNREGSNHER